MTSAGAPSSQMYFNSSLTTGDGQDWSPFPYAATTSHFGRSFDSGQQHDFNLTTPAGLLL